MDKSQKVRLIQEVRDRLTEHSWDDTNLLLSEFGFDEMQDDSYGNGPTQTQVLQQGDPQNLIALASHLSVDATEPVADETPNVDGSRSPEPLLIFASHQSHHRALVGQVADEHQVVRCHVVCCARFHRAGPALARGDLADIGQGRRRGLLPAQGVQGE